MAIDDALCHQEPHLPFNLPLHRSAVTALSTECMQRAQGLLAPLYRHTGLADSTHCSRAGMAVCGETALPQGPGATAGSVAAAAVVLPAPGPPQRVPNRVIVVRKPLALRRREPRKAVVLDPEGAASTALPAPDLARARLDAVHSVRHTAARGCTRPCQSRLAWIPGDLKPRSAERAAAIVLPTPQAATAVVHAVAGRGVVLAGWGVAPCDVDGGAQEGFEGAALAILPAPQAAFRVCAQKEMEV